MKRKKKTNPTNEYIHAHHGLEHGDTVRCAHTLTHQTFNRKTPWRFFSLTFSCSRTEYPNYIVVNGFISRFQFPLAATTTDTLCTEKAKKKKREKKKTHTINYLDFSLRVFPHPIDAHFLSRFHTWCRLFATLFIIYYLLLLFLFFSFTMLLGSLWFFTEHTFHVVFAVAFVHWPIVSSFPNK